MGCQDFSEKFSLRPKDFQSGEREILRTRALGKSRPGKQTTQGDK
jgi:hypothetical protein